MPKRRLSELSLLGRRVLFSSKLELSARQRGKYPRIFLDQRRPGRCARSTSVATATVSRRGANRVLHHVSARAHWVHDLVQDVEIA
jgi:hypothetical protein